MANYTEESAKQGGRGPTSRLLLDEQPLQVLPSLAARIGLNRAVFIQQVHYWLSKPSAHVRDGRRWIYNTYEEWHEQFPFWTVEAIRKIVAQLRLRGLIETTTKYNKRRSDRTLWYTIDYAKLDALELPDKSTDTLNPPDKSTEAPDKSTEPSGQKYGALPETTPETTRNHSVGASGPDEVEEEVAEGKPMLAKYYTTLTIDRTREVDFDATWYQKNNWGQGFDKLVTVPEGQEPPNPTRIMAVVNKIVESAAAGYFLSVSKAEERLDGKGNGAKRASTTGKVEEAKEEKDYSFWFKARNRSDKRKEEENAPEVETRIIHADMVDEEEKAQRVEHEQTMQAARKVLEEAYDPEDEKLYLLRIMQLKRNAEANNMTWAEVDELDKLVRDQKAHEQKEDK